MGLWGSGGSWEYKTEGWDGDGLQAGLGEHRAGLRTGLGLRQGWVDGRDGTVELRVC